jgi:hypothetical protein
MRLWAVWLLLTFAAPAVADPSTEEAARDLEQLHARVAAGRRRVSWSLLAGGLVSVAVGAGLVWKDGDDQAWRFAGGTALAFWAIDALLGGLALPALAGEERRFAASAAERRSPAGLERARRQLLRELSHESVIYAVNLGLDVLYAGAGAVAIIASQQGVSNANAWLATGVVGVVEGLFLVGVDLAGLLNARGAHDRLLDLVPIVAVQPSPAGPSGGVGLRGHF